MKDNKLEIVYKNVDDLIPYARNSRTHSEQQVNQIASSIKEFGMNAPIAIDADGGIIAGHGRVLACQKLGIKTVPTVCLSHLSETEKKAYIIADNKLALNAGWDLDLLKVELQDLETDNFDLSLTGFDNEELKDLLGEETAEDIEEGEVGEPPENPKSQKGDIWILGEHRLMCGDSTSENDIKTLMQDEKADLVFTDPPYKIESSGAGEGYFAKSLNKQKTSIDFISHFDPTSFLKNLLVAFNKDYANIYIFCNKDLLPQYLDYAVDNGLSFNVLVWKKPNPIPVNAAHYPDTEYLLFFRKNAIWNYGLKGVCYSRCLEYKRVTEGLHPTMKPIGLIANELQISSNRHSIVLDFFGGSGSTLIACEQLGRKARLMELDEHYCDVIINRWQKLTNKEAVRVDGVKFNDLQA